MHGAAQVRVNGVESGAALVPPFRVDVSAGLRAGANQIEVLFVPPLRNAVAARIEAGDAGWESAAALGQSERVTVGLLGPVSLVETGPAVTGAAELTDR